MSARGILNQRGLQFLRGGSLIRQFGADVTGPEITVLPNVRHVVGFTSGVVDSLSPNAGSTSLTSATSGFTIPANGTYYARAIVHASGTAAGIGNGDLDPRFGIALTLGGTDIAHSVRSVPAASGMGDDRVKITKLETECIFEAQSQDTLAVSCISDSATGQWTLVGAETANPSRGVPIAIPAAILTIQRLPTLPLDNNVYLK